MNGIGRRPRGNMKSELSRTAFAVKLREFRSRGVRRG